VDLTGIEPGDLFHAILVFDPSFPGKMVEEGCRGKP
jgi:hypothetical protein